MLVLSLSVRESGIAHKSIADADTVNKSEIVQPKLYSKGEVVVIKGTTDIKLGMFAQDILPSAACAKVIIFENSHSNCLHFENGGEMQIMLHEVLLRVDHVNRSDEMDLAFIDVSDEDYTEFQSAHRNENENSVDADIETLLQENDNILPLSCIRKSSHGRSIKEPTKFRDYWL